MIISIYRVQCEGPCGRYLSDVIDAKPAMTVQPGNALSFTDRWEVQKVQAQVFSAGLCPRCKRREDQIGCLPGEDCVEEHSEEVEK